MWIPSIKVGFSCLIVFDIFSLCMIKLTNYDFETNWICYFKGKIFKRKYCIIKLGLKKISCGDLIYLKNHSPFLPLLPIFWIASPFMIFLLLHAYVPLLQNKKMLGLIENENLMKVLQRYMNYFINTENLRFKQIII